MLTETLSTPIIRIRGRSFMALIVAPEPPFDAWFTALDEQMQRSPSFFIDRPIVANLAAAISDEETLDSVLDALSARGLRIVGVEGIDPALLAGTPWAQLANLVQRLDDKKRGDEDRTVEVPEEGDAPDDAPPAAMASLLIDRPVRSGQSIIFEEGDITIIGPVSSGAEVIAGGSIHIYGTLRGRAIAGLKTGTAARIFCRKLAAELVAIDGLYNTAEHYPGEMLGRAVQIQVDRGALKFSVLD